MGYVNPCFTYLIAADDERPITQQHVVSAVSNGK